MPAPDEGRLVLVTGASRGIGRAAAVELARRGAHVLALARTVGALEALDDEVTAAGGKVSLIPADLTDEEAMARLPDALAARFGRLDALILNAGTLGELMPVTDVDGKLMTSAMRLNVGANWQLLAGLDPLLRESEAGRVVGVTSSRARKAVPFWGLYAASKAAFERLVLTYAAEREDTPVRANLLDPGPIATKMRAKAMPGEDQAALTQPEELAPLLADMAGAAWTETGGLVSYRERAGH
jgi:NAD(P)-dependent dehydrogenase (short-subunit alcohol dehydrogenase family)